MGPALKMIEICMFQKPKICLLHFYSFQLWTVFQIGDGMEARTKCDVIKYGNFGFHIGLK